jgi:hypothetical protein
MKGIDHIKAILYYSFSRFSLFFYIVKFWVSISSIDFVIIHLFIHVTSLTLVVNIKIQKSVFAALDNM